MGIWICSNCGASNSSAATSCDACGQVAPPKESGGPAAGRKAPPPPGSKPPTRASIDRSRIGDTIVQRRRCADIMFVLDCTGSMGGEIDAIKETIIEFAELIEKEGVRARVGLVEFRDRLIDEEHRVLQFSGSVFTSDPRAFRAQVSKLKAEGGGDEPESSLDAVLLATRQPFDPEASKVIVLITDAPPHIPDLEVKSVDEVVAGLRSAEIQQVYLVIRVEDERAKVYLRLLEPARGLAFDLGKGDDFRKRSEHFKKTLMALGKTITQATT